MLSPFHMKTMHPLQVFSLKSASSSSSSALSSTKLKSLIHTLVVSHMCRLIRALSKLKTLFLDILRDNNNSNNIRFPHNKKQKSCSSKTNKIILGSFRLHYNWCSSKSSRRVYQELNTTVVVPSGGGGGEDWAESELAGYLQWLEEKVDYEEEKEMNEIDMLAEMFIADCHEKFRLEKQESERRFHEMLARGI